MALVKWFGGKKCGFRLVIHDGCVNAEPRGEGDGLSQRKKWRKYTNAHKACSSYDLVCDNKACYGML